MTDPILSGRPGAPRDGRASITVSVVSHGHRAQVLRLLQQLCDSVPWIGRVVLTHNLPDTRVEAPQDGWPFAFTELFNGEPKGFGANHNRAFEHCDTDYFCVLNPDIELPDPQTWPALIELVRQPRVGCAYPVLLNEDGSRQENARELVTPVALLRRHLLKARARRVDWVSGAFCLLPAQAWRSVGGFDVRFHMYCEDVDLCLRLQLAGWRLAAAEVSARHPAAWGSRRQLRHLAWHVRSLLRLWRTPAYHAYRTLAPAGADAPAS